VRGQGQEQQRTSARLPSLAQRMQQVAGAASAHLQAIRIPPLMLACKWLRGAAWYPACGLAQKGKVPKVLEVDSDEEEPEADVEIQVEIPV
jgi:hypothetical protein